MITEIGGVYEINGTQKHESQEDCRSHNWLIEKYSKCKFLFSTIELLVSENSEKEFGRGQAETKIVNRY